MYRLEDGRSPGEYVCDLGLSLVDKHLCDKEGLPDEVILDEKELGLAVLGDTGEDVDVVLDDQGPPVFAATSAVASPGQVTHQC